MSDTYNILILISVFVTIGALSLICLKILEHLSSKRDGNTASENHRANVINNGIGFIALGFIILFGAKGAWPQVKNFFEKNFTADSNDLASPSPQTPLSAESNVTQDQESKNTLNTDSTNESNTEQDPIHTSAIEVVQLFFDMTAIKTGAKMDVSENVSSIQIVYSKSLGSGNGNVSTQPA